MAFDINSLKNKIKKQPLTEEEKARRNPDFISAIAPIGGISFDHHEKFVATGTGYEACLYIYKYPVSVAAHWLNVITGLSDTVCVLDISSTSTVEIKKNLRKSLSEQQGRYENAKSATEQIDAEEMYAQMDEMYREVSGFGNVMKTMLARVYVPAQTMYEADIRLKEIVNEMTGDGFACGVCLNETKSDWRNVFLSYTQQQQGIYKRKGQPMLSKAVAAGNPFHFSSLSDPCGTYFGKTTTGGSVCFDLFHKDARRLSYSFSVAGNKGSGKSTLLKKIMVDRAMRGDFVRIFDVTGEFGRMVEYIGGTVLSLDGSGKNKVNILQILPDENTGVAYNKHIAKVSMIYQYLRKGAATDEETLLLKQLLRLLYEKFEILDAKGALQITLQDAPSETFPTFSDFRALIRYVIDHLEVYADKIQEKGTIRTSMRPILEKIELKINDLCKQSGTYGDIFDGHTTIRDFYGEKVVCFDMSRLAEMEEEIYDAQFYNALCLCRDQGILSGKTMRDAYQVQSIAWEDITRTVILMDECHKSLNAMKPYAVREVVKMLREDRKYFIAFGFATQRVHDIIPQGSDAVGKAEIKALFELTQYKFITNHDASALPILKEVFQSSFSETETAKVPGLERGECILSIAGDQNLHFYIYASDWEIAIGDGGA